MDGSEATDPSARGWAALQEQQGGLAQEVELESGGTEPENALEHPRKSLKPGQIEACCCLTGNLRRE